ncbi:MAG: DUF2437 domain-containing protein, partial [Phycisphaerae bacterium]|nr:DUF2437 domain-containing protein [Phycisphaerae bacterium]
MRIIRFRDGEGRVQLGVDQGDGTAELLEGDLFASPQPTGTRAEVARLLAPLDPRVILCIGLNYRQHAEETGAALPQYPVLFMKNPAAVNHPGDAIV